MAGEDLSKPYINYRHLNPKRAPKAQPVPAEKEPDENCQNCIKKCKNPKRGAMNYGCWCGKDLAPAANVENEIPADESKYYDFIKEKGLPQPSDAVDECCMYHDLRLGQARQKDPNSSFISGSTTAAGINYKMSWCLKMAKYKKGVHPWGRVFAGYADPLFSTMSGVNLGGAGVNALTGAGASAGGDVGFGGVGASSAGTSAGYNFGVP